MKFLVEIPDEHMEIDNILARDLGHMDTPENRIRDLLFEHFEFVTEMAGNDPDLDKVYPDLDYPEIKVTKVDSFV